MNISKKILSLSLGLSSIAFAEIREAANMEEAFKEIDQDTLVIFDLDNTVMRPVQMIATDMWFDYIVSKYEKAGVPTQKAKVQSLVDWTIAQKRTKMIPVETSTPEKIAELQAKGIKVFGLTARPFEMIETTLVQLKGMNVDFSKSSPAKKTLSIPMKFKAEHRGGIVFGGLNDKGEVLKKFMALTKTTPKKIVFIDDKEKNVKSVEAALSKSSSKMKYINFRYGAADPEVKAFDPSIADIQWNYLVKDILSDDQARKIQ